MASIPLSLDNSVYKCVTDATVTLPNGKQFTALAGEPNGISPEQGKTLEVDPAGTEVILMNRGSYLRKSGGNFVQVFTPIDKQTSA